MKIKNKKLRLFIKIHRHLLKSSSILSTVVLLGFVVYLFLPPLIRIHKVLDLNPKSKLNISTKAKPRVSTTKPSPNKTSIPSVVITKPSSQPNTQTSTSPKPNTTTSPSAKQPAPVQAIKTVPSSSVKSLSPAPSTTSTSSTTSSSPSTSSSTSSSSTSTNSTPNTVSTAPETTTDYTSSNWSGYLASGESYSSISASWNATDPSGNGASTSADATWIGIGGVTTHDLIQVGTDNSVSPSGQISSSAFYELLPSEATQITTMVVSPNDSISASIQEVGTNEWTINITDSTSNTSFTTTVDYDSSLSSAEWIEEDPSNSSGQLIPFDNFGSVEFRDGLTTVNGTSQNIIQSNADSVAMTNSSGQFLAAPSEIASDGADFTDTRENT